ncbi:MAG: glutathione S-transferase N-terminal domain-containing protein [Cyanobacteria bacterium P01_D01_bin.36]
MELIVGTDSSWSLRAWICMKLAHIKPNEIVIDLDKANYKTRILEHSPSGLVPVLKDGEVRIHDSLAIVEYLNECSPGVLYPEARESRALARSLCAEVHSGFAILRNQCPFTLDLVSPLESNEAIRDDLHRAKEIFESAEIPYMFGRESAVDGFYAILAYRLRIYGITLSGKASEYQKSLLDWALLQEAIVQAKKWRNV